MSDQPGKESKPLRKAIAVDFDGCLCSDAFPDIGAPNWEVITEAIKERTAGAGLILWTCREGKLLEEAVTACAGGVFALMLSMRACPIGSRRLAIPLARLEPQNIGTTKQ